MSQIKGLKDYSRLNNKTSCFSNLNYIDVTEQYKYRTYQLQIIDTSTKVPSSHNTSTLSGSHKIEGKSDTDYWLSLEGRKCSVIPSLFFFLLKLQSVVGWSSRPYLTVTRPRLWQSFNTVGGTFVYLEWRRWLTCDWID